MTVMTITDTAAGPASRKEGCDPGQAEWAPGFKLRLLDESSDAKAVACLDVNTRVIEEQRTT